MKDDRGITYSSLQAALAFAASIVVAWHLQTIGQAASPATPAAPTWLSFGYAGVDIFFVLSGFIISLVISKDPEWPNFLANRARRILPFYWIFTTLALLAKIGKHVPIDPANALLSYLTLPQRALPALFGLVAGA